MDNYKVIETASGAVDISMYEGKHKPAAIRQLEKDIYILQQNNSNYRDIIQKNSEKILSKQKMITALKEKINVRKK